jgi:hypothetical protein
VQALLQELLNAAALHVAEWHIIVQLGTSCDKSLALGVVAGTRGSSLRALRCRRTWHASREGFKNRGVLFQ